MIVQLYHDAIKCYARSFYHLSLIKVQIFIREFEMLKGFTEF